MEVAVKAAANAGIPRERLFLLEGEGEGFTTVGELIEMGRREGEQVDYFRIPEGKTNFDICEFLEDDLRLVSTDCCCRRLLVVQLWNHGSTESCKCIECFHGN